MGRGETMLAADASLASALLEGATNAGGAEMWPVVLQVRWLNVAAQTTTSLDGSADGNNASLALAPRAGAALLDAIGAHRPHLLVPHAAALTSALVPLAAMGTTAASVIKVTVMFAAELRVSLSRLSLRESHAVIDGLLRLILQLSEEDANVVRPEVARLFSTAVETLPAKFRSERVFQKKRKHEEGISGTDIAAWCTLLADAPLLVAAVEGGAEQVTDELWHFLRKEAVKVIARGELDDTAVDLLCAFADEGRRRQWNALDATSPLAALAAAITTVASRHHV